jgi:hypothetical protein
MAPAFDLVHRSAQGLCNHGGALLPQLLARGRRGDVGQLCRKLGEIGGDGEEHALHRLAAGELVHGEGIHTHHVALQIEERPPAVARVDGALMLDPDWAKAIAQVAAQGGSSGRRLMRLLCPTPHNAHGDGCSCTAHRHYRGED